MRRKKPVAKMISNNINKKTLFQLAKLIQLSKVSQVKIKTKKNNQD